MSESLRRLWFVRHGETVGQSSIRYHGSNDVPLSELGRSDVQRLVRLCAGVSFTRVVHSPLSRAAESAAILARGLGIDASQLTPDERLREISFGACEGLTREEIEARFPGFFRDYEAGRADAFPAGEPRAAFARRIVLAVRELAEATWHGDLLIVAHRGTVRYALAELLGGDEARFGVDLASLSVVRQDAGRFELELLGMRG